MGMRLEDLMEAPLGAYELFGNWNTEEHEPRSVVYPDSPDEDLPDGLGDNSFVSKFDRALIQDPKTEATLRRFLKKIDMPIHVLFLNSRAGLEIAKDFLDYGEYDDERENSENMRALLGKALTSRIASLRKDRKALVVVLTHNEGGEKRHPMTPWMIVHRMAHACGADTLSLGVEFNAELMELKRLVGLNPLAALKAINTFRAARENMMVGDVEVEVACELFTQYIVTGRVKFRVPQGTPQKNVATVERIVRSMEERLTELLDDYIKRLAGQTVIC